LIFKKNIMRTDMEKQYFINTIEDSKRKYIIISPEFRIIVPSRHITKKIKSNIVEKLCYKVFFDHISPCHDCPAQKALKTQIPALRKNLNYKDNDNLILCSYSYPIFDKGKISALAVLEFDRPTKEEMREELQRANAFLKNLILSSVDAVIAADLTGKIFIFNSAATEVSGYSADEALNKLNIRDVYPENGAKNVMKKLRSDYYGGKGKLKSCMVEFVCKNGEIIPICLTAAIVYEGKQEVGTIGFFRDMREELKIKAKLEKTQLQLIQAEKMSSLGKLAAGVAHQLNNPLTGITLFTKLILEEYNLEDPVIKDLQRILQDALRCRDIVKALLEFARQTSNTIFIHDINKAISRTIFLLENQSLFQNIDIIKAFEKKLPTVPVDIQQMNHVFMNIILNAVQAMDTKGTLTITTAASKCSRKVYIEISDTGPGVPDNIAQHIFEPFFTTKKEGKGTGLGLSMAYGIVQNHGGNITVKTNKNNGATFIIELPLTNKRE